MNKFMLPETEIIPMYFTLVELEHVSACLDMAGHEYQHAFGDGQAPDIHELTKDLVNGKLAHEYEIIELSKADALRIHATVEKELNKAFDYSSTGYVSAYAS